MFVFLSQLLKILNLFYQSRFTLQTGPNFLTFGLMYQKKALLLWLQLKGFDQQIKKETIFCPLLLENIEIYCILSFAIYYELSESRNLTLEKKLSQFKPSKVTNMMMYNYRIQLLRWHNPFLYIFICLIKHDQNF